MRGVCVSRKRKRPRGLQKDRRAPAPRRNRKLPNRPLLVLALLGMALSGYLSANSWFGSHAAYCGAGSNCDLVQTSHWSTLFGLPIAAFGFLTYAALGFIALQVRKAVLHFSYAWIVALVGLGVSLYLTAISLFVLEAACLYCLASLGLMATCFAVVARQRPEGVPGFTSPGWLAQTGAVAILIVVGLHLYKSGVITSAAGPESPYLKALALHLEADDAKFYGASWCPHCREQKDLFTASASRLPYIECSPQGRSGPTARACAAAEVEDFPTWVIAGKRYVRVLQPEALARYSGFEWTPPATASAASDP